MGRGTLNTNSGHSVIRNGDTNRLYQPTEMQLLYEAYWSALYGSELLAHAQ